MSETGQKGSGVTRDSGSDFSALLEVIAERGARGHSTWSRERFLSYAPLARTLWTETRSRSVVTAYLEVVREGVALGHLGAAGSARPSSLLEHCVAGLAAPELAGVSPAEAVALLATTWNLCEGLAGEPEWMQSYVLSRRTELASLAGLADYLVRVIEPVIAVPPPSSFRRDVAVSVLDTRSVDDEFLPGELVLVAPTVLAVRDRRRPVELGVLLRHGRKSELLGRMDGGRAWGAADGVPSLHLDGSTLAIEGSTIELPLLVSPRTHAVTTSGFVVVTAEDSQRLWVVESR